VSDEVKDIGTKKTLSAVPELARLLRYARSPTHELETFILLPPSMPEPNLIKPWEEGEIVLLLFQINRLENKLGIFRK
jgi:hypothetical protein